MGRILDFLSRHKAQVIALATPLVLLPLPILVPDQVRQWLRHYPVISIEYHCAKKHYAPGNHHANHF